MAFIDTSDTIVAAEIPQIYARYVTPGQSAEATFKFLPGQVFTGKVETVLQAVSTGQTQVSGLAVTPKQVASALFIVRIALDDPSLAARLPAGSTGDAAIFTDHAKATHVIRRVMLRMTAIVNYVNPYSARHFRLAYPCRLPCQPGRDLLHPNAIDAENQSLVTVPQQIERLLGDKRTV